MIASPIMKVMSSPVPSMKSNKLYDDGVDVLIDMDDDAVFISFERLEGVRAGMPTREAGMKYRVCCRPVWNR